VEIDFDHNLIIIHSRLPADLKGYARSKIKFIHSYPCAEAVFKIGNNKYVGDFMFETGSDQALILDSRWAAKQNLTRDLKLIRTSVLHDGRGVEHETRVVLSPLLEINGWVLRDIPTLVMESKKPANFEINFFGNDLLKRFNMVLDFRKDYLYLKPNKLMGLRFRGDS